MEEIDLNDEVVLVMERRSGWAANRTQDEG